MNSHLFTTLVVSEKLAKKKADKVDDCCCLWILRKVIGRKGGLSNYGVLIRSLIKSKIRRFNLIMQKSCWFFRVTIECTLWCILNSDFSYHMAPKFHMILGHKASKDLLSYVRDEREESNKSYLSCWSLPFYCNKYSFS